jgi:hypothetical protein
MNSISGFLECSTRYHFANGSTAELHNGSAAGRAGLVDGPLLGCVGIRGRWEKDIAGWASNKILAHGQKNNRKKAFYFSNLL